MAWLEQFKGKKKEAKAAGKAGAPGEILAEPVSMAENCEEYIPAASAGNHKRSWFDKMKSGLSKTRKNLTEKVEALVKRTGNIDEEFWEELEDILIQADVGVKTSFSLVKNIRGKARKEGIKEAAAVIGLLREEVERILASSETDTEAIGEKPHIILVVGVNGAGKTTSIAKLAYKYKSEKRKVLLAAGDTYRAAAIDQLQAWADRVEVELIKHQEGSDPGAVVFDAIVAARARKSNILIIDTAGRLQNKTNLMKEISKIKKVIEREGPGTESEVLLVLDATTGQNAISQARLFQEATGISGIVLTKLDGTAKGGIVLAIADELRLPVKYVGIGEAMDDLRKFSASVFAEALFGD